MSNNSFLLPTNYSKQDNKLSKNTTPTTVASSPLSPSAPAHQSSTTMQSNARYQSVPRVGDDRTHLTPSRALSPLSSSAVSTTTGSSSQRTPRSRDEQYTAEQELGPYSHMRNASVQSASMRSRAYNPSANSSKNSSKKSGMSSWANKESSYHIEAAIPTHQLNPKNEPEPDDYLHEGPDDVHHARFIFCSGRGCMNVFILTILIAGLLTLFAGYPIISHFERKIVPVSGNLGPGGTNGTGQIPIVIDNLKLIDSDTPSSAMKFRSSRHNANYHLVFSDEFEEEGRTFWPGEDPFWEAVDLWYGATGDYEWYTPEQVNTTGGHLLITLDNKPMHNLNFRSGMLQSWNKFCFQGGYIEFSIVLPGAPTEVGWWPGLWTMGNLARPGYLGTTDGMWPYSYNGCDSGILLNQTAPGRPGYDSVTTSEAYNHIGLSWLNGMRASACTCSNEDHPGPNPGVGRSAPELDILEAQIQAQSQGEASQSLQVAPFDPNYLWSESGSTLHSPDAVYNTYKGGIYQEAVSAVTPIPATAYARTGNQFTTFAAEYQPDWNGDGNGYITWYLNGRPTWTATGASLPPRPSIDVGQRLIPVEPMSIIMNLGMSRGFQADLDFNTLTYPATLKVDYVRVYQNDANPKDLVSCDPPNYPTAAYISRYPDVYQNPNHTTWPHSWPRNRITGCQ